MAPALKYRLHDPGYTLYHRAALGGLASTLLALKDRLPKEGLEARVLPDEVHLDWSGELTAQEALRRLLRASFRLTKDKLIDLPGQRIPADKLDLRLAIHNGLCMTFLQHNKMRPSEKQPRLVTIRSPDDEGEVAFSYKAVNSYAHQEPTSTGLFSAPPRRGGGSGGLPEVATITQYVVPGAVSGAYSLEAAAHEVFLLLYLMVGSAVFMLRPRVGDERIQSCIVLPEVVDLVRFSRGLQELASMNQRAPRFTNTYLGRVVGGAEEAALRFLLDLALADVEGASGVAGCQAITMGKVAWDKNQTNRTGSVRLAARHPEMDVFKVALQYLGQARVLRNKDGQGFAVPRSPLPGLLAANLGAGRHWAAHFRELVQDKNAFRNMMFHRKGVQKMGEAIRDEEDRLVISAFHEAWNRTLGQLGERARREGADFERLANVEQERARNDILRQRTAEALAGWFLRFCASASRGAPLAAFQRDRARLHAFLFQPRNAERLQNLLLFALVSYARDPSVPTSNSLEHS